MPPGLFSTAMNQSYMSVGYQLMFPTLSDIGAYLMIFPGQLGGYHLHTTHSFSDHPLIHPPNLLSHTLSAPLFILLSYTKPF